METAALSGLVLSAAMPLRAHVLTVVATTALVGACATDDAPEVVLPGRLDDLPPPPGWYPDPLAPTRTRRSSSPRRSSRVT